MKLSKKIGIMTLVPAALLFNAGLNKVAGIKLDKRDIPTYYWDKNASAQANVVNNTKTTLKKAKVLADKGSEYPKTMAFLVALGLLAGKGARKIENIREQYQEEMLIQEAEREEINKKNNIAKEYVNNFISNIPEDVKTKLTEEENQILAHVDNEFALDGNQEQLNELISLIKDKSDNNEIATEKTYKFLARLVHTQNMEEPNHPIRLIHIVSNLKEIKSPYFLEMIEQQPLDASSIPDRSSNTGKYTIMYILDHSHGKYLFNKLFSDKSTDVEAIHRAIEVAKEEKKTNSYEMPNIDRNYLSNLPDDLRHQLIAEDKVFKDGTDAAKLLNEYFPEESEEITDKFKQQALQRLNGLKDLLTNITKNPDIMLSVKTGQTLDKRFRDFRYYQALYIEDLNKLEQWIKDDSDYIQEIKIGDGQDGNTLHDTFETIKSQLDSDNYEVSYIPDRIKYAELCCGVPYHTGDHIFIKPKYDMTLFYEPNYKYKSLHDKT